MTDLTKMMIVNLLGRQFGFANYMELATPSTGRFYSRVDRDYFSNVFRMMYLTPYVFDDGLKIDFRSPDEDITGVMEDLDASGRTVDICLVDGWHTYQTAYRDLARMFDLLADGGVLVVHDCLPESRDGASPRFRIGEWWGQSYKAFLDFVLRTPSLDYFALDCDHGCGVIIKNRVLDAVLGQDGPSGWLPDRPAEDLLNRWFEVGTDVDRAYTLFEAQHRQLLRLVPADRFLSFFSDELVEQARIRPPEPLPQTSPASAGRGKQSLNARLVQFLNRKFVEMTDQKPVPTASKTGLPDKGQDPS